MTPDKPNPFVYDIKFAEDTVEKNYRPQMELLSEICNYGSNLLLRCFREKNIKFEDLVILSCLLRQFLVHLDAVYLLLSKGNGDAALIHLRAMLEEQICFEWLTKTDTANRAKHLYVWNLRKRRRTNRIVDPTTDEAKEILASVGPEFAGVIAALQTPEHLASVTAQNANIDALLASPEFATIDQQFEKLRDKKKKRDIDWYKPCGIQSIAAMAKDVNMTAHYRLFYSKWSEIMHSSGFFDHMHVDELGASIEQVRNVGEIANAISLAASMAHGVFHLILRRYRPNEQPRLSEKYFVEWRERLRATRKVNLNRKNADW